MDRMCVRGRSQRHVSADWWPAWQSASRIALFSSCSIIFTSATANHRNARANLSWLSPVETADSNARASDFPVDCFALTCTLTRTLRVAVETAHSVRVAQCSRTRTHSVRVAHTIAVKRRSRIPRERRCAFSERWQHPHIDESPPTLHVRASAHRLSQRHSKYSRCEPRRGRSESGVGLKL